MLTNIFFKSASTGGFVWIGGRRNSNLDDYKWLDGTQVTTSVQEESDEFYLWISGSTTLFYSSLQDAHCNKRYQSICQIKEGDDEGTVFMG